MNKIILNIIAFICISISILSYLNIYIIMFNSNSNSKGLAEFFTLISSILFIISVINLASIINTITKFKKNIILLIYLLFCTFKFLALIEA